MYKKKQRVEVEIIDLGDKNQCFGRLDDGMGIFVQGTAAVGDTVTAEIFKIKKRYLVSRFCELVKPSPHRIDPICPYFGLCGGCKWQHMDYPEQLRLKRKQVQDALEHIGGFADIECEPCLPAPERFGYRNKMDFSFTDLRYLSPEEIKHQDTKNTKLGELSALSAASVKKPLDFALGFHAPGCYAKAIDLDHCDLSTPEMNLALNTVRAFCLRHKEELPIYSTRSHTGELRNLVVRHGGNTGEFMVNLVTSTHNPELMQELCGDLKAALGERLTTFVNNTTTAKNTVAFGEKEFVLHGSGFITDRLGDYTYRISANSFFQTNTAQAEKLYRLILETARLKPTDVVYDLFCGTGSISLFASGHCQKVLGVELVESSVNDSLARDGQMLCEEGQYKLVDCQPIDMFPQTNHVESVARFERVQPNECT
jgi:23S rRNA (uracil1939-C5)-methyltransferase